MKSILLPVFTLCCLPLSAQQNERLLVGNPYLQNVTPEGATVMYQNAEGASVHSFVEVGEDSLHTTAFRQLADGQEVVHDVEHRVRLEGLQPGKTYYYRVCATEITENRAYHKTFGRTERTPFFRFTLPADTVTRFTALVLNDLHGVPDVIDALARLADSIPHDFVIFNGDCLSEPADRSHALRMWHRLATAFRASSVPCIFLRGNHEIRNAYSSGMLSLFEWAGGHTYHAFSWGDTRFVMLDCGEDKPDSTWVYYGLNDFSAFRRAQQDFLKRETRSKAFKKAARRILVHHIPLWHETADFVGPDMSLPCRELWLSELAKAGIDLSLNAHTHHFRYYPVGSVANPYPVLVGGGPSMETATLTVLQKRGSQFSVRVLNARGEVLEER
ncbi:MAG: metallophosphoesterase [Alloprevotella sp.]